LDRIEMLMHDFIDKQAKINAIPVINSRWVEEQENAKVVETRNAANA